MAELKEALPLPDEMILNVFGSLPRKDIKNVRLVNQKMHRISSPLLISRAYIAARPKTLQIFNEIVSHPVFSQSISEVVYDCSEFHDSFGDGGYIDNSLQITLEDTPEYIHLLHSQTKLYTTNQPFASLVAAAKACPKLTTMVLATWKTIIRSDESAWYLHSGPMSWDICGSVRPSVFKATSDVPYIIFTRIFSTLAGSKVRHFIQDPMDILPIQSLPPHALAHVLMPASPFMDLWRHPGDLSNSKEHNDFCCFAHCLYTFSAVTTAGILPPSTLLYRNFLATCYNLRILDLSYSFGDLTRTKQITWPPQQLELYKELIWHLLWPHLHTFKIAGCIAVEADDLLTFLRKHKSALRSVTLADLCLIQTNSTLSWVDIIKEIRISMPLLLSFHLSNLHERYWILEDRLPHLCCQVTGSQGEIVFDGEDCAFRRGHLDVLERWVLDGPIAVTGQGKKGSEEELDNVRLEWHDFKQMPCWADMKARVALTTLGYIA